MRQAILGQTNFTGKVEHLIQPAGFHPYGRFLGLLGRHIPITTTHRRTRHVTGTTTKRLHGRFFFCNSLCNLLRITGCTHLFNDVRTRQRVVERIPIHISGRGLGAED